MKLYPDLESLEKELFAKRISCTNMTVLFLTNDNICLILEFRFVFLSSKKPTLFIDLWRTRECRTLNIGKFLLTVVDFCLLIVIN